MQSPHRIAVALRRTPVHLTLILICAVWTVPVLGLLVSSFRPAYDITTTGWWEVPASLGHLNIGNYLQVLSAEAPLLAQESLQVDLRARALDVSINLVRALGGGLEEASTPLASATP